MPTNLLLLPLLGGYWFLHTFYYTKFRSQRLDGYRLLVESALAGVVLVLLARLMVALVNRDEYVRTVWFNIAPADIPFFGTASASLLVGFMTPYVLNFILTWTAKMTVLDAKTKAIERHGNDLLRLLHTASLEERAVSIWLDNGKVYIGVVAAAPNLAPHDTYLSISPFYSGYREKETLELVLTVDYLDAYERHGLDPAKFRVVLPMASICMASLFDQSVYAAFRGASGRSTTGLASGAPSANV